MLWWKRIFVVGILGLLCVSDGRAQGIDGFFLEGNELYRQGEFEAAIAEYKKILEAGYESWAVYYNLGNAYYRIGEIGRAILNYERARRLNPKNDDVQFNLELAQFATVDQIQEIPPFFLSVWWSRFAHLFDLETLGVLAVMVYVLFVGMVILKVLLRQLKAKRAFAVGLWSAAVVLLILGGAFAYRVYENETVVEAVLLVDRVDVKSAPDDDSTNLFSLHEGVKMQLQEKAGTWLKIRLADGKIGWLRAETVERI